MLHGSACAHPSAAAAQSNHRSWADFYLDVVATDGNAQMLSRMAVAYVFPMFMLAVCIIRSVVLFKRGEKVDHEARPGPPPRPSQGFPGCAGRVHHPQRRLFKRS